MVASVEETRLSNNKMKKKTVEKVKGEKNALKDEWDLYTEKKWRLYEEEENDWLATEDKKTHTERT